MAPSAGQNPDGKFQRGVRTDRHIGKLDPVGRMFENAPMPHAVDDLHLKRSEFGIANRTIPFFHPQRKIRLRIDRHSGFHRFLPGGAGISGYNQE